jgi:hypothetical protein
MDVAQFTSEEDPREESENREGATTTPLGDLPSAVTSVANLKLMKVYGAYIHQSDGTHVVGGIAADDTMWQEQWAKLIVLLAQHYWSHDSSLLNPNLQQ